MGPRYIPNSSKKPKPKPKRRDPAQVTSREKTPGEKMAGYQRENRHPSGKAWNRIKANVISYYGGICHLCSHPGATQVDHLLQYAEGGDDSLANLRPAHGTANTAKNPCPVCGLNCNNIRGALSVEAGKRKIARRQGTVGPETTERDW